ncbi:MAG: NUDIX domain-containing protein [Polyangiaceae bacterium]|nr:NUDIX domain-containing protein [Polyangiaceae bacterium]
MPSRSLSEALPAITLEVVDAEPPLDQNGFLRLVRRRYRAHYPDGAASEPFTYDSVTRRAVDAVVIAAHHRVAGRVRVYLRSAVRPPITERIQARSAVPERGHVSLWELPAGLVEPGEESSLDGVAGAARRELFEELGFDVDRSRLVPLGPSTFPAPGFAAERHFYFSVEVDPRERAEPTLDGSPLERGGAIVDLDLEEALALAAAGELEDAKTELGLRRLQERLV